MRATRCRRRSVLGLPSPHQLWQHCLVTVQHPSPTNGANKNQQSHSGRSNACRAEVPLGAAPSNCLRLQDADADAQDPARGGRTFIDEIERGSAPAGTGRPGLPRGHARLTDLTGRARGVGHAVSRHRLRPQAGAAARANSSSRTVFGGTHGQSLATECTRRRGNCEPALDHKGLARIGIWTYHLAIRGGPIGGSTAAWADGGSQVPGPGLPADRGWDPPGARAGPLPAGPPASRHPRPGPGPRREPEHRGRRVRRPGAGRSGL
jgi:hypothetical protein